MICLWVVVRYRKGSEIPWFLDFALRDGMVPFPEIRNIGRGSGLREAEHGFVSDC